MSLFKDRNARGPYLAQERRSSASNSTCGGENTYSDDFETLSNTDLGAGDRPYYRTEETLAPLAESPISTAVGSTRNPPPAMAPYIRSIPLGESPTPQTPTLRHSPQPPKGPNPKPSPKSSDIIHGKMDTRVLTKGTAKYIRSTQLDQNPIPRAPTLPHAPHPPNGPAPSRSHVSPDTKTVETIRAQPRGFAGYIGSYSWVDAQYVNTLPRAPQPPKGTPPSKHPMSPDTSKTEETFAKDAAYPKTVPMEESLTKMAPSFSRPLTPQMANVSKTPQPPKGPPRSSRPKSHATKTIDHYGVSSPVMADGTRPTPSTVQGPTKPPMPQSLKGRPRRQCPSNAREPQLSLDNLSTMQTDELTSLKQPKPPKRQKKGKSRKTRKAEKKAARMYETEQVQILSLTPRDSDQSSEPENPLAWYKKMKKNVKLF